MPARNERACCRDFVGKARDMEFDAAANLLPL